MIETIRMEEELVEDKNIQVKVLNQEQINEDQKKRLLEFFKAGYGERWISDENFTQVMIPNATEALTIESDGKLAGVLLFDHNRISDISVHPDFQGQGYGGKLFKEAVKVHPEAWISIGIDAEGMLATITSNNLNFMPVEDKGKIEELFSQTNRGRNNFQVEISEVAVPILTERLVEKGINKDNFTAFVRTGSTHGAQYWQVLFQNNTGN